MADAPEAAVLPALKVAPRKNFPKPYVEKEIDGETVQEFPFLVEPADPRDVQLFMAVINDEPWSAIGETTKAWDKVALGLRGYSEGGTIIFHTVSGKSAKDRFEKICADMKKWRATTPWRCGCDDENLTPFMGMVEHALDLYFSFLDEKDNSKQQTAAERQKDKEQAEACMTAAVDGLSRDDLQNLRPRTPAAAARVPGSSGRSTPTTGSSNKVGSSIDIHGVMEETNELLRGQQQVVMARLDIKRKSQEYETGKLNLERDRFEDEKIQKKFDRESQLASQAAQFKAQASAQKAQTKLLKLAMQVARKRKKNLPSDESTSSSNEDASE